MLKTTNSVINASQITGTLPVSKGGTGLTSLTAGYIPYGNGTSALNSSSNLSYDGTNLRVGTTTSYGILNANGSGVFGTLGSSPTEIQNSIYMSYSVSPTLMRSVQLLPYSSSGYIGLQINSIDVANKSGLPSAGSLLTTISTFFSSGGVSIGNTTDPGAGNLRFNTTGSNGIYFGSSSLLSDYEVGTWTPAITAVAGTITSYTASGYYTKVGRLVTLNGTISITNNGTGATGLVINGIPYSILNNVGNGTAREGSTSGFLQQITAISTSTLIMYTYANTYPATTGSTFVFTITYFN